MRHQLFHGDCRHVLAQIPENSVDAVVTDPPGGLSFLGAAWDTFDRDVFGQAGLEGLNDLKVKKGFKTLPRFSTADLVGFQEFIRECFVWIGRVMKPGAYGFAWATGRSLHRTMTGIEAAGLDHVDVLVHHYACLDEETEILIDGVWRRISDGVSEGSALCYDAEHDEFRWGPIGAVHVYDFHGDAVRIRGVCTDQLVTPNHRCLVERDGTFQFAEAWTLEAEATVRVPVVENLPDLLRGLCVCDQETTSQQDDVQLGLSWSGAEREGGGGPTQTSGDLPQVRGAVLDQIQSFVQSGVLQHEMHRRCESSISGIPSVVAAAVVEGVSGYDSRDSGCRSTDNDRPAQSGVEGWRYLPESKRELRFGEVCEMPGLASGYGEGGWVHDGAPLSRGPDTGAGVVANRGCSPSRSRFDEQPPGQPGFVSDQRGSQAVRGVRYTTADVVRVGPEPYHGRVWCLTVPTGAFVARRRGKVFVTGNSGFPKNHNIEKAFDKAGELDLALQWAGWGTALKPATEFWILFQRSIAERSIAANIRRWGVGALNLEACRVQGGGKSTIRKGFADIGYHGGLKAAGSGYITGRDDGTRWPANLVMSCTEWCTDQQCHEVCPVDTMAQQAEQDVTKFFYCSKPSPLERHIGGAVLNDHATVKPVKLCSWLARLVCPPGGHLLDPFMGSGTVGLACVDQGFRYTGVEQDRKYFELAGARIRAWGRRQDQHGGIGSGEQARLVQKVARQL